MTDRRRICAIADDLTGAAEIAGAAHRRGRSAAIVLDPTRAPPVCDTLVFDSETRLLSPADAAARVREMAAALTSIRKDAFTYKKTDSVLRGNVRAEIEALTSALGHRRALLVPANPSQGRTIRDGIYRIGAVPLAESEFARDPHHPARSSVALELLGSGAMPLVNLAPGAATLPDCGIVLGDAATSSDVSRWAAHVDETTLPAGGREFFEACLTRWDHGQASTLAHLAGPALVKAAVAASGDPTARTLIISGSVADAARNFVSAARRAGVPVVAISGDDAASLAVCVDALHAAWSTHRVACAVVDRPLDPDPRASARFAAAFAQLAQQLFARRAFGHLILEGGATAAAVLHALPIPGLHVTGEWASGVVALQSGDLELTMKPGSYAWPEPLTRALLSRA